MSVETILTNARIVTANSEFDGTVVVRDGLVAEIADCRSRVADAIDLEGDYLVPGLVELHTDNMEKHFAPRPGVKWPSLSAVMAHDTQIAAAGITTVFDSLALGDVRGDTDRVLESRAHDRAVLRRERTPAVSRRPPPASALRDRGRRRRRRGRSLDRPAAGRTAVDQRSHAGPAPVPRSREAQALLHQEIRHDQRRSSSCSAPARRSCISRNAARHRREIVARAQARALPIASHDDATREHVQEAVENGMTIAEFPTTREAAQASREAGLAVLVGAPNLVMGGSHSGNIAAIDLLRDGEADILSSDYVPASLMESIFKLRSAEVGISLPEAVRAASLTPARAVGLCDRGEIAAGRRADFVRVRRIRRARPWCGRCGALVNASSDMAGALVYVMGPSGAGKDSVLERARALLSADLPIAFAHRYITRPADVGGENHVALSRAEFALRRAHGLFAFHWHAHGNDYGIGREIHAWRRRRPRRRGERLARALPDDGRHRRGHGPVLITAPAERLKERLLKRGREDASATAERLQRGLTRDLDVAGVVTITNDGALDDAAEAFVRLLATLRLLTRRPPPSLKRARATKGRPGAGLTEDAEVVDRQRTVDEAREALAQQVRPSPSVRPRRACARSSVRWKRHCSST